MALTGYHTFYKMLEQSRILVHVPSNQNRQLNKTRYNGFGFLHKVRVQSIFRGPKKKLILLYYGQIKALEWDPAHLRWPRNKGFMHYNIQLGRDLLQKRQPPLTLASNKWPNILPDIHRFKWNQVWNPERAKLEAGFIWQLWHKAVAINA
jgi:hypothetical protein